MKLDYIGYCFVMSYNFLIQEICNPRLRSKFGSGAFKLVNIHLTESLRTCSFRIIKQ